ncbi:helix-turn-helix domain-containing protein (plasmid) [Mesorhizobium sp. AR07]|nr:helix-turn-helix domain-containing protein [Mesorhizobium sp. AR07]
MNIRYRVELSQSERDELRALVSGGKLPVRRLKRMQILLAADAGVADEAIAISVQTSDSTIYRTKKRFVEISLEAALSEGPRPGAARKLSGKQEVQLVALACSDPPQGCARWTLKLLANALVEVIEHPSVRRSILYRLFKPPPGRVSVRRFRSIGFAIAPAIQVSSAVGRPNRFKRPFAI